MTKPAIHESSLKISIRQRKPSSVSVVLLFILVLSISISPRISLGAVDAEIRLQDILIFPLMIYLFLAPKVGPCSPVYRLFGNLLPVFFLGVVIVVSISIMWFPHIPVLRRVLYLGRTIEMFLLAIVIAGLFLRSGQKALPVVLNSITVGALLNLFWTGYQLAAGVSTTLLGQEFSNRVEGYGPRLIGEPSAFGTGQYWAFVAAVAAAQIKVGSKTPFNVLLFICAFVACWLAESRISMGSIVLIAVILLITRKKQKKGINIGGIIAVSWAAILGIIFVFPTLDGRLSPDAMNASLQVRVQTIWEPLFQILATSPLVGVGPGGLLGAGNQSEAHNVILRSMADFGIIVGPIFIVLFMRAMTRGFQLASAPDLDKSTYIASFMGGFCILSTLTSGLVQDSLTAVMSSHLTMVAVGVLAATRVRHEDAVAKVVFGPGSVK